MITTGEKNLNTLLRSLTPELHQGTFVYCTTTDKNVDMRDAVMVFREAEGSTLILPKEKADAMGLPYAFEAAWITLTVHSSLEAVGLTAAFSNALTKENISCNVVAGYYHDHLFVPVADAQRAMTALRRLSEVS